MNFTGAPRAAFPKSVNPMLATLVEQAPEGSEWRYEIKWDGYRAVALCDGVKSELLSRNNKSFNEKFYPLFEAVKRLKSKCVLDGEAVVIKESGVSSFGALQNWRSEADGELLYYVFDVLWLDGHDLKEWPLSRRQELLHKILPATGPIRISEHFTTSPARLLAAASRLGLEGIIAKRAESVYLTGARSRDWLKIKLQKRHEVVIGGYTKNEDSPKAFSSLLVGVYDQGRLQYTGKIGTGFNEKMQASMMQSFKSLVVTKPPFETEPDVNAPSRFRPNPPRATAVWLKPKLVCEVSYTEMTTDGVMRHPAFEGMREDKKATDVHAEVAQKVETVIDKPATMRGGVKVKAGGAKALKAGGESAAKKKKISETAIKLRPAENKDRKTFLNPSEDTQVRAISGHELTFRNLGKVYWPGTDITKRDLLNYYYQAAPYILPYLKDRPQSLNRFPNGITGKSFYQKDITHTAPDWVKQFPYHTSLGEDKNYLVVEDEASLLWMANMGAIEMNPWNSRVKKPDHPDWCIIDLDPTEKNPFSQVIRTAQVVNGVLDEMGVEGYPKTSGSTGIHIYIPMGANYTYDECQLFGKLIAKQVHERLPKFTSIERMKNKRKGMIYVDYLQNRPKATLAAPYAVRPKAGATVSMPIHWEEVATGLKMKDFTLRNSIERIKREGDLFKPVLGKGINLKKILKHYDNMISIH